MGPRCSRFRGHRRREDPRRVLGLVRSVDHVRRAEVLRIPFGYPVQTHSRAKIVTLVKTWLSERRIYTVGRFGEWAYINSDEALHRGYCLGLKLAKEESSEASWPLDPFTLEGSK